MDTKLSNFRKTFILLWAAKAKRRVKTFSIIESFDPFKDARSSLLASHEIAVENMLLFERAEKTLNDTVVPAVTFAAHAAGDLVERKECLVVVAGVLATSVRVSDEASLRLSLV